MVSRILLLICLLCALAFAGNAWFGLRQSTASQTATEATAVRSMGIIDPTAKHLSPEFTESDGSLLAAAPVDPAKLNDPATIVLAHLADADETQSINWTEVEKAISTATGRKVVDQTFDNSPEQLEQIKAGAITIVALHAADTPFLVNNYGYQPIAVMGDLGGAARNKLDLIVPPASPLKSAADLHTGPGVQPHNLTCSVPSSITGYRAAVALLLQNQQLRPNVDYFITWSLKMKESIRGIAEGKYELAAVSDDKLQSMLASDKIAPDKFRIIYTSDVIPRTTVGCFYNLKPDLAQKIRSAILAFIPASPTDKNSEKPMRFIPVDYKKDFALVRQIDDRFDPRLDTKIKLKKTSEAATAP